MTVRREARLLLDAIAELHGRGHGRLKIKCYVKEGIGAWRHWLFAADDFPQASAEVPRPSAFGSLPDDPVAMGATATEISDRIATRYPELLRASLGQDALYCDWFRSLLNAHPGAVLEMEGRLDAVMGGVPVTTPYAGRGRSDGRSGDRR